MLLAHFCFLLNRRFLFTALLAFFFGIHFFYNFSYLEWKAEKDSSALLHIIATTSAERIEESTKLANLCCVSVENGQSEPNNTTKYEYFMATSHQNHKVFGLLHCKTYYNIRLCSLGMFVYTSIWLVGMLQECLRVCLFRLVYVCACWWNQAYPPFFCFLVSIVRSSIQFATARVQLLCFTPFFRRLSCYR